MPPSTPCARFRGMVTPPTPPPRLAAALLLAGSGGRPHGREGFLSEWEISLPLRLSEDNGEHRQPPMLQFGERLAERPRLQSTVMQQCDQGALVGTRIRLPLH